MDVRQQVSTPKPASRLTVIVSKLTYYYKLNSYRLVIELNLGFVVVNRLPHRSSIICKRYKIFYIALYKIL